MDNIINYMVLEIYKFLFKISNGVNNVTINSGSTNSLTKLFCPPTLMTIVGQYRKPDAIKGGV